MAANDFVSAFCQWAEQAGIPARSRKRLPAALRRAIEIELPSRDSYQDADFRTLVGSAGLGCQYFGDNLAVLKGPTGDSTENLLAVVLRPVWERGWGTISQDELVCDSIDYYFYAVTAYIARSRFLGVTAAIALSYGRGCDFQYGTRTWRQTVGHIPGRQLPVTFRDSIYEAVREQRASLGGEVSRAIRTRAFRAWLHRINALDPTVHRMLFQFIRATRLRQAYFLPESLTALDCAVDVAAEFVRDRLGYMADNQRGQLLPAFRLGAEAADLLGHLAALRNYFGAHPSQSGWWDFQDKYGETVDDMFSLLRRLIWLVLKAESEHRVVEPNPSRWSEWFTAHSLRVSRPVWFLFDGPSWEPLSAP